MRVHGDESDDDDDDDDDDEEKESPGGFCGLEVERIDAHAKRMFTTLSAEKQSGIAQGTIGTRAKKCWNE